MLLRPTQQQIAQLAAGYAKHRPHVQRALTAGFVLYVLSTTYNTVFARSGPAQKGKGKGRAKGKGTEGPDSKKPPRVAVRNIMLSFYAS